MSQEEGERNYVEVCETPEAEEPAMQPGELISWGRWAGDRDLG